jgi:heat shock protein HtpX
MLFGDEKIMSIWKLRATVIGTLTVIIGLSTLFFVIILTLLGTFDIVTVILFVAVFNLIQWLIAPYLIGAIYRVKEVKPSENPKLYGMVENLSKKSGIKTPRVMIANMPMPNAFAYGSPIAGKRLAVTSELLTTLNDEEVEAVVGHELGHLKHRDVQVMMFVSILPAIFYYIGYSMLLSSMYRGRSDRDSGGSGAIIGIAGIALYWILTLFTLQLSRAREYYADRHSASIVEDGPRKLSEGLAKIVTSAEKKRRTHMGRSSSSLNSFKALFISDPDTSAADARQLAYLHDSQLVEKVMQRQITTLDRIQEALSTHPNIVKRLRALKELEKEAKA